jgi:ribonuclease T
MSEANYQPKTPMARRFRGFLPVVIDVETGGFDAKKDALLEVAAVMLDFDENDQLICTDTVHEHVKPFPGAHLDPKALEFTGIKPFNPFRFANNEKTALENIFAPIKAAIKKQKCQRAVLVGHNPGFDLGFLHTAIERTKLKSPFHLFTTFDTATLGAVAYGQTVLLRAARAANIEFDPNEAHSALYDAQKTAELFCKIVNQWPDVK